MYVEPTKYLEIDTAVAFGNGHKTENWRII